MKTRCIFAVLFLFSLLGCSTLTPRQTIWCQWEMFGISDYSNFYYADSNYPNYAIAVYSIREDYDAEKDMEHVRDATRLCRKHFGQAFRAGKLQRMNEEDSYDTNTFEPKPGWRPEIPFDPHFVVIAIQNRAEHKGASSYSSIHKVAYIIPAELVFSKHLDFGKAIHSAYVDRNPFHFEPPAPGVRCWSEAQRFQWLAIERHEAHLREKTEPGGAANGSQPIRSETNSTSSAAGSRR